MKIVIRCSWRKQITEISWGEIINALVHEISLFFNPFNSDSTILKFLYILIAVCIETNGLTHLRAPIPEDTFLEIS